MKLLAVIFLASFALASALPVVHDHGVQEAAEDFDFSLDAILAGDDSSNEVAEKLREAFNQVLEKIREAIEKGKGLREDLLNKLKDVREKMKERGVNLGERAKEILERIREKGREFFQKIMERLNLKSAPRGEYDVVQKNIRETFEKVLDEIKEAVHKGKDVEEELHQRLRQAFASLRAAKVSLSDKALETLDHIKEKAKHVFDRIAEDLGFNRRAADNDDSSDEVSQKLRDSFEKVLEKIREAIEKGKGLHEDLLTKLKDVREKMKERGVTLGERAKEILERIREKGKEFFQRIMDRLNPKSAPTGEHDVVQTYVKEMFEKVLDEIKEAVHKGKDVEEELHQSLRQAFESLRAVKVPLSDKAFETLDHIKEKAKHVFDRIVEDLGFVRHAPARREHDVVQTYIREAFDKVLEEIKEAVHKGKDVEEELHQRLRQAFASLRAAKVSLSDKALETLDHIKEKAKHVFDRIVEDLGFNRRAADSDDSSDEVSQKLRDSFEKVLEKIREAIEKGKGVREDLLTKLKDVREKMKERGVTLGERAKEILERIREKGKEFFQRIMDRLNPQSAPTHDVVQTYVKEAFEKVLEEIKEAVHKGQDVEEELHDKLRQAFDNLRAVKVALSDKAVLTLEHIKEKAGHVFDRIAQNLGFPQQASAETEVGQKLREAFEEILEKIKESIDQGKELKQEYIEKLKEIREQMKVFKVELSNQAKELLEKVRDRVKEFWNNILDNLRPEQRSIADVYHKIRDYLKDLHIELKEKFVKFGEWAKDKFEKGLEKGKDRAENIRNLAKQFIEDAKHISKDVAEDAKEFFREYKEDLGHIYDDLRLKIKDILKNN